MESLRFRRGFTLIELMVVLAIIVIVTTVVLTNQSSFNKTLILSNTAYDIALSLRSAQTYGLSSRASGTTVNTGYGVHFSNGAPSSFTLFADAFPGPIASNCHGIPVGGANAPDAKPGDCVYESTQGEKVLDYMLGNSITVSDFCTKQGISWSCTYAHDGASGGLSSLDIVFARPNSDTFMSANGSYAAAPFSVTAACITIASPQGGARYVSVSTSGQIIANALSCP